MSVIWHDLECGSYAEDLKLWRALAAEHGDPVLDIGAGTGRVSLDLARRGHRVTALDHDSELLEALSARADGLHVQTAVADAREFTLEQRFALCIVPMQTIQLLGGPTGRVAFLRCAAQHLVEGGVIAIAITPTLEIYEVSGGAFAPLPDITEIDGVVYSSQPTAVRAASERFVLVRRREKVSSDGLRQTREDEIELDRLSPARLEDEAGAMGLRVLGRAEIPATREYVGSMVVMLGG